MYTYDSWPPKEKKIEFSCLEYERGVKKPLSILFPTSTPCVHNNKNW